MFLDIFLEDKFCYKIQKLGLFFSHFVENFRHVFPHDEIKR